MRLLRHVVPALVAGLFGVVPLCAQDSTGSVAGKVLDGTSQQPLFNVEVAIPGSPIRELTRADGTFELRGVHAGAVRVRASRIGYGSVTQEVTVTPGGSASVQISMVPAAAILEPVVVTGYGTQRREAITGSVSTVSASAANVGVITNVDQMLQARAAGVEVTKNNGEPGAGTQILIRGGSSISNTNDPLYVIDGVPIYNQYASEPPSFGVGGSPPLPRNPLNLLNPADISSITILKDASATAIYGSRAANGVILIETKKGSVGGPTVEYEVQAGMPSPYKRLDMVSGSQYRDFIAAQVVLGNILPVAVTNQGT